jgi:hypothetical protein
MKLKLKCEACGTEKEFADHKEAFTAGWDFPPMAPVTTCDKCPSAPLVVSKLKRQSSVVDVGEHMPDYARNPNPQHPNKKY